MGRKLADDQVKADAMELALQQLVARYQDFHHDNPSSMDPAERARLLQIWKKDIRLQPAYVRWRWLFGVVGEQLFGRDQCRRMIRQVIAHIERHRAVVPSGAWLDDWGELGADLPRSGLLRAIQALDDAGKRRALTEEEQAERARLHGLLEGEHAVRMKRRRRARFGQPNRWTPPTCFEMEDFLDGLSNRQADRYFHPPSPSAVVIQSIEDARATEERWMGRESKVL